jgi:2-oxoisovalerate dehydrogenase E2 component (dihydrolipoyl transacylase)
MKPGLASPAVRALARERGVDLAQLAGSGPGGTVTRADVERATAPADQPLAGVRRAMAINMARAHAEVVPATVWEDADVEAWWSPKADVTVRLIRAIAVACAAVPALNARYDGKAMVRRMSPRVDLGIAVDSEDGLIVPVLRDAGGRDLADLRRELDRLTAATRARSIALADLRDPTITLSNFGTLGGRHAALVVLPPQVAILGAGRIAPEATHGESGILFRRRLPLSLTFDHRVVTGGEAARFLTAMIEDLQQA